MEEKKQQKTTHISNNPKKKAMAQQVPRVPQKTWLVNIQVATGLGKISPQDLRIRPPGNGNVGCTDRDGSKPWGNPMGFYIGPLMFKGTHRAISWVCFFFLRGIGVKGSP